MLKNIVSFKFLANHASLFLRINKKLTEQDSVLNEYFSNIAEALKETQKHIKEYRVFLDNRIKPLCKMNFVERIKPFAWVEVYEKIDRLQDQCWNLQTRIFDQAEHLNTIKRYKIITSQATMNEDDLKESKQYSLFDLEMSGDLLGKMILGKRSGSSYNIPSMRHFDMSYSRSSVSWIFKILFVLSVLLSISSTFFSNPIASFVSSTLNINQNSVLSIINIIRITSYVATAIPIIVVAFAFVLVIIDELRDTIKLRKGDGKVAKKKESKVLRIMLFVFGSSFLAASILSQSIIYFVAPLIGLQNVSAVPQTMISIIALIIALLFIFASLYNAPTIRNIFISQDIEQKYLAFKDETLEKLQKLAADLDKYKSESVAVNNDNTAAINELKTYTYDQIQDINAKILEKIHQFELAQVESLFQCKSELLIRLDRMQGEIDGIQKQVANVDSIIDELRKLK